MQEPAPVGIALKQNPHWGAKRSGQMRDRRIDCDHQIEALNQRCRIGEVLQPIAMVDQMRTHQCTIGFRRLLL